MMRSFHSVVAFAVLVLGSSVFAQGVTADTISLGQSCALQGPASALGKGMQVGLEVAFNEVNANGGVQGRKVELTTVNDGYEPKKCVMATTMLVDKKNVFALIGGVGTPTAKVAVPIIEERETPFIAPFTGAEFLRNPYKKWVVNLRGSYYQEMEELARLLVDQRGMKKIACFYQNDGYGAAGLSGIKIALEKRGMELCATGTYERNSMAIAGGLKDVAAASPEAVIMVGAYKPCAGFIKLAKDNNALKSATFCNISFVGTDALLEALGSDGEGCVISQVVPFPWDKSLPLVAEYHAAMEKAGKASDIGFVSLEGYIAVRLFAAIGNKVQGDFNRENYIAAVGAAGTLDISGFEVTYGATDHQGSDKVWLTVIQDGKITPLENAAAAGN